MRPGLDQFPSTATAALVPIPRPAVVLAAPTLRRCVRPFLVWLRSVRGRSILTLEAYRKDLECATRFLEAIGVEDPARITHREIEAYLGWLGTDGGRSASTVMRRLHSMRTFWIWLAREGLVPRNVAAESFGPSKPKRMPDYLTTAEQEHILATLAGDQTLLGRRDHALVATALLTGLRCNELARLQVAHLRLEANLLRVIDGKGAKDREAFVIPRLRRLLDAYLGEVRPALLDRHPSPFVFVNAHPRRSRRDVRAGLPLLTRSLWALIHRRVSPMVGRPVNPHMLRHSFASRLRAGGADLQLIQEALGHVDIRTTTMYAHLATPARLAEVARLLGDEMPAGTTR
jgi:site-specific recombinase XerD